MGDKIALSDIKPVFLVLITCSFLLSCSVSSQENTRVTPTLLPTLMAKPSFILEAGPSHIDLEQYIKSKDSDFLLTRGIHLGIWVNKMNVSDENCNWDVIRERISLFIDGEKVRDDTLIGGPDGEPGCGIYRFNWSPDIDPGIHEINFQFETDAREKLNYKWLLEIEK